MRLDAILHPRIVDECWDSFEKGNYLEAARWAGELMSKSLAEACGITTYVPPRRLIPERVTVAEVCSDIVLEEISDGINRITLALPAVKYQNDYEKKKAIEGAQNLIDGAFQYYRNFLTHNLVMLTREECARAMAVSSEIMYLIETADVLIEGNYADGLTSLLGFKEIEQTRVALEKIKAAVLFVDDVQEFLLELAPYGLDRARLRVLMNSGMVCSKTVIDEEQASEVVIYDLTSLGLSVLGDIIAADEMEK